MPSVAGPPEGRTPVRNDLILDQWRQAFLRGPWEVTPDGRVHAMRIGDVEAVINHLGGHEYRIDVTTPLGRGASKSMVTRELVEVRLQAWEMALGVWNAETYETIIRMLAEADPDKF